MDTYFEIINKNTARESVQQGVGLYMNAINSNEQMIQKINEVLQNKKDAIVNIIKVIVNL